MTKGLLGRFALLLGFSMLSAQAWATDTLYINSQAGDQIANGEQATYTDSIGTFSVTGTKTLTFKLTSSTFAANWTVELEAPNAASLTPGVYDNAREIGVQNQLQPGIFVIGGDSACSNATGRFIVRDIETDGGGNVTVLAVDFWQQCQNASGILAGGIRFNSTLPYPVAGPTADAGGAQLVLPGAVVTLDGSLSLAGSDGPISAYTWTQLSGPGISLSNSSSVKASFTAPSVPLGGSDLVFQLETDDALDGQDFSAVTVHVANAADPVTVFTATGDAGSGLLNGKSVTLNTVQATFTPKAVTNAATQAGNGVELVVNTGSGATSWTLQFAAPVGQSLQIGQTYDGGLQSPADTADVPELYTSSSCVPGAIGDFTILDLQTDGNGNITSFAADFQNHCPGTNAAALRGVVRYNSTVPLDAPVADAGPAQVMTEGDTVTLSGSTYDVGGDGGDITSYQWVQISGPTVTLSDPTAADPTFTAPGVDAGGSDIVFQLTVTNSLGLSSSSEVTVHVADSSDAVTLLQVQTETGGLIAVPESITVSSSDMPFSVALSTPTGGSLGLHTSVGTGSSSGNWAIGLTPPTQTPVVPPSVGTYDIPGTLAQFGSVTVTGPQDFSCSGTVTSRFAILDIQLGAGNVVDSLAADFDEFCSSSTAVLHGKLRYDSSVPLETPVSDPGSEQLAEENAMVTLSGTASYAGTDTETIASYQWSQLSGPAVTLSDASSASPTFTAPTVDVGGADLSFQLTVTNSDGLSNSSDVTVHVRNPADPFSSLVISSDPNDFIGQGRSASLNALNATFSIANVGGQGVQFTANLTSNTSWVADLQAAQFPQAQALAVGAYDNAGNFSTFDVSIAPGIGVSYVGFGANSCETSGSFVVLDIQRDQNGNVTSLAADLIQHCNSDTTDALRGKIRYNSTVPLDAPYADPGVPQTVEQGQTVTLGGSGTVTGGSNDTITSVQWTQVSGPTVTLSDPSGADPSFTAPSVGTGGADLVFEVTVTNSEGLTTTSTVTVHIANPNDPKTIMYLQGGPDDPATQGSTVTVTPQDANFTATPTVGFTSTMGNVITLAAAQGPGDTDLGYALYVQAALNAALAPGRYDLAQNLAFEPDAPDPGINVRGLGNCAESSGQFLIRDLQYAQDGSISSFAADVLEYCMLGGANVSHVYGWIRYNSKVPLQTPIAVVGPTQNTFTGFSVTLDGSQSVAPTGTLTYQWTQIVATGDPVATLSGAATTNPSFVAPNVATGGRNLVFQLTVTGSNGLTDSDTVTVHVGSQNDPKSLFVYDSTPGDPAGNGIQGMILNGLNGGIDGQYEQNAAQLQAGSDTGTPAWEIDFELPGNDAPFQPGIYFSDGTDDFPRFLASNKQSGTCNTPETAFIVRDVKLSQFAGQSSLGMDFVQHCAGATGSLVGIYRMNSATPTYVPQPTAIVFPMAPIGQAGTVTLDGSLSLQGSGGPATYAWKQVSGPAVQMFNSNRAVAQFKLPANLLTPTGTTLAFALTVTNASGSNTMTTTVMAILPSTSSFSWQSDAGDPVGLGGNNAYVTPVESIMVGSTPDTITGKVHGNDGRMWNLQFAMPKKQLLRVGNYTGAVKFRATAQAQPGLDVNMLGAAACRSISGDFQILDVEYAKNGGLDSLALNFDQTCDGASGALHGKLRYHSAVP